MTTYFPVRTKLRCRNWDSRDVNVISNDFSGITFTKSKCSHPNLVTD